MVEFKMIHLLRVRYLHVQAPIMIIKNLILLYKICLSQENKDPGQQKILNSKVIQTLKQDNLYLMGWLILVIIFLGYIPFLEGRACNHACPDLDSRRLAEIITNIVIPVGHFLNKYGKISFYEGDKSHQRF